MKTVTNPFELITDNSAVIAVMTIKSELMIAIRDRIATTKLTQVHVAELCGITQPRVSALVNGNIDQFSVDELIRIATYLGGNVSIIITNQE